MSFNIIDVLFGRKKTGQKYYEEGLNLLTEEKYERAAALFQKSAAKECADGCYQLGICYRDGIGVSASLDEARAQFTKAAELGCEDAAEAMSAAWNPNMVIDPELSAMVARACRPRGFLDDVSDFFNNL